MKQWTGSKLGKEYVKTILSPCLFNIYEEYIMWNAGLDESQAGIKIARKNTNNLRYADGRNWRGTKELLDEGERKEWKSWLKTKIQKTKIMASSPITSWWIEGGKVEAVTGFIFLGSKITVDGDCSHKIKRCLSLGWKAMTNLDSILKKQRHHFSDKDLYIQSYGFFQ